MKAWLWMLLSFAAIFAFIHFSKLPPWVGIALGAPILVVGLVYGSVLYSYRPSLAPAPVPRRGYESRTRALDVVSQTVQPMDFKRFDGFYLKTVPDVVIYAYRHEYLPVYLCVYHLGSKSSCDFVSEFEHDISLTTTASADGGMLPRPETSLLQVIPSSSYQDLFHAHMQGHIFLKEKGCVEKDVPIDGFRDWFMHALRENIKFVRKIPFWPVRAIYWTITKRGRIYQKRITRQYEDGMITCLTP